MMAKKAKKAKLPKKLGGVKIPKELRGAAAAIAAHPVISDIVAAGLIAAAAALTESKDVRTAAKAAGEGADDAAADAARKASKAKKVVKAAAGAMGAALLDELAGGKSKRKKADADAPA
jgi:hypothetical protein